MRDILSRALKPFSWISGLAVLGAAATVVIYLALRGGPVLGPRLVFGDGAWLPALLGTRPVFDGLWPAIAGTIALVIGATAIAVPLGVASGIYLAEYGEGRWCGIFGIAIDILASIPSILIGLFGFGVILFLRKTLLPGANTCLFLSIACLAALVLPYPIRATEGALRALPVELRLAGASLGLSRGQTVLWILLPAASRGILGGIILAIGRAAEDTAVILLTGAVANAGTLRGPWEKFEALPFTIYLLAAEHRTAGELDLAFGAALVLLLIASALFAIAFWLHRELRRRWT